MDRLRPVTPGTALSEVNFLDGCLLPVDKPTGWTSFDVVNKLRYSLRSRLGVRKIKVGHSGTLDPMATGLLLICTGKWTKKLSLLEGLDKEYRGKFVLGVETDSYDAEGKIVCEQPVTNISCEDVESALDQLRGQIEQVPPAYSAIKVKGQPLYKSARRGEHVKIESRPVTVHQLQMIDCAIPEIFFRAVVSKGTYIRSLAHDTGTLLECGAHLAELQRTAIGSYNLMDAWHLDDLVAEIDNESGGKKTE